MADIYIVDDHALMRDGLTAVLEHAGHRVVGSSDHPTSALAQMLVLAPKILLLDLNLGQRSGFELLERLQARIDARQSQVRVIVLTMSEQPRDVAEALRLGASGYLQKGSSATEVLSAVEAVCRGEQYLAPVAARMAQLASQNPNEEDSVASLSPRERQVVLMVVRGYSSADIGAQLHLSPKTVDSYRSRLMAKLGVGNVPALVRLAIRENLISVNEG
jgi:two-component system, NarL family, invasion response regulator UvrY